MIYTGTAGWAISKELKSYFPPEGTHLERYARTFKTAFPAQIDEGLLETRVLLEEVEPRPKSRPPAADLPLEILDASGLDVPEGTAVHAVTDETVPVAFSITLAEQMKAAGKTVELFTYPGDDHNIAQNFGPAITRSVAFFNKHLK